MVVMRSPPLSKACPNTFRASPPCALMWHVMQPSTAGFRNGSPRYICRNSGIAKAGAQERKKTAIANNRVIGPPHPTNYDLFEQHAGYVRVAIHIKAPGLVFVFPGIIDPDAWAAANRPRIQFPIFDP